MFCRQIIAGKNLPAGASIVTLVTLLYSLSSERLSAMNNTDRIQLTRLLDKFVEDVTHPWLSREEARALICSVEVEIDSRSCREC